ncbi:hypothetical protein [Nonomuraea sp. LPB2021202275-12-8]|uniref:hypothetical protein n=1 Tax=Nonomuraea sp. LPB2021202275-12-8 TaxID=3120159 RepID=UPI00300DB5E3
MNRGWIVSGALILATAPAVPAAADEVSMVLDRVDDPGGRQQPIRTGDVLRYRVRFDGTAREARLAVAASPVHALTSVTCAPPPRLRQPASAYPAEPAPASTSGAVPLADTRVPAPMVASQPPVAQAAPERAAGFAGGAGDDGARAARMLAAKALAATAVPGSGEVAVTGARTCVLGGFSGKRAVDVVLTVPQGAGEVALAAVAEMRTGDGEGLTTMKDSTGMPVKGSAGTAPNASAGFGGPAVRVDANAEADQARTARQQVGEPGTAQPVRLAGKAQLVRQPGETAVAGRPGKTATAGQPGKSAVAGQPGKTGVTRQPGTTAVAGQPGKAAVVRQPEAVGQVGQAASPQAVGQVSAAEALLRAARNAGTAGDLMGSPGLGGAPEVAPQEQGDPRLELPAVPTAAVAAATAAPAPSAAPVSWDAQGAPLPRTVPVPQVRLRAAEVTNPLAGARGMPVVAGGIAVLLGGLWVISRTHRARARRKVF